MSKIWSFQVFILCLGLSHVSYGWRPSESDSENPKYEVTWTPHGGSRVTLSDGAGLAKTGAGLAELAGDISAEKAVGDFTEEELRAAFHDHSAPMPSHMLDALPLPSSMTELQEEPRRNQSSSGHGAIPHVGTSLRGVLDFFGYAFLIEMDRQGWTKSFEKNSLSKSFWKATGKMMVKLLRYPENVDDQDTKGRKLEEKKAGFFTSEKKYQEVDLKSILGKGFVGQILLVGWFDDLTMHFRGRAQAQEVLPGVPWFEWMIHMYMPWREVDIRFDDAGAHCRFDWEMDKEKVEGIWNNIKKAAKSKEVQAGMFRLDALPDQRPEQSDPTQVYSAQTYSRNVMSSMTIRMDECTGDAAKFTCVLEQRPMSTTMSSLFRDNPYEHSGKGAWFTFIGTIGRAQLGFEKGSDGNYVVEFQKSWCAGFNPCPFIVPEPFKAQWLDSQLVLQQTDTGLPQKRSFMFYRIFDEELMETSPVDKNLQVFEEQEPSTVPEIKAPAVGGPVVPAVQAPVPEDAEVEEQHEPVVVPHQVQAPTPVAPSESCGDQKAMKDEIAVLKAAAIQLHREIETLRNKEGRASTHGKKTFKLVPGEDIVIQSDYT